MRLTLILPSWFKVFGSFDRAARNFLLVPPLNLMYLAAIAEENGHSVQLIDGEAERLSLSGIVDRVKEFSPDLIGITSTTPTFHLAAELAGELKKGMQTPIVAGGPHITFFREKVFYDSFDYFVIGQCEGTFAAFLNAIDNGGDVSGIPGLVFRKNGKTVFTGENPQLFNLNELPFPARHLLKLDEYIAGSLRGKKKYTTIMCSRGCPFSCVFCSTDIYGKRVRTRPVANVIKEIKHVINDFGIDHFYFEDDTLTLNRKFILELCGEIEKENLKFTWEGHTRANLFDEELASRMSRCGLIRLSFGLETADENVMEILKKGGVKPQHLVTANELATKYNIESANSVMLGLPGDTRESIKKTISFIRNNRAIKHSTFGIAIPYPGSEMYQMALRGEHGLKLLTQDFSKYQRYNSAVMSVNGMMPEELLRLQRIGLLKIYAVPWRIRPLLKRYGILSPIKPLLGSLAECVRAVTSKLVKGSIGSIRKHFSKFVYSSSSRFSCL